MQDQYQPLDLLGSDRIPLYRDESEPLYPEQSTGAIVTYHPGAKYFSAYSLELAEFCVNFTDLFYNCGLIPLSPPLIPLLSPFFRGKPKE